MIGTLALNRNMIQFSWVKIFKQKKDVRGSYGIILWYEINWFNQVANVIQNLRLIFLSLSISGTVKTESNTFYKYEYE